MAWSRDLVDAAGRSWLLTADFTFVPKDRVVPYPVSDFRGFALTDEPLALDGLALAHHPAARAGAYVLAGHLHPCVWIGGRAFDRLRLPCFHFGERVGVLPAFGGFTGMHPIRALDGDRVFAVADDAVAEVPVPARR